MHWRWKKAEMRPKDHVSHQEAQVLEVTQRELAETLKCVDEY